MIALIPRSLIAQTGPLARITQRWASTLGLRDSSLLQSSSFVDGSFVATSKPTLKVLNPFDGKVLNKIQDASTDDATTAVRAAQKAFTSWVDATVSDRSTLLTQIHAGLREHRDDFARLITLENGKPISQGYSEVDYASSFFEWCAQPALHRCDSYVDADEKSQFTYVTHAPTGIVFAITPWNFPLALLCRKVAAALAAGCTMVAKPSERTPLSALALAEVAQRAGAEPGVLNVIVGTEGKALVQAVLDERVDSMSFTGSTKVGHAVGGNAVAAGARVELELGGNAPLIICEDADVQTAVEASVSNKLRCNGQTCVAINRILVHDAVHDNFIDALCDKLSSVRVGNGLDSDTQLGPLIDADAAKSAAGKISDSEKSGAQVRMGGAVDSAFMEPTVVTNVSDDMSLATDEIFAPVWSIQRFHDDSEASRRANIGRAGLAAYVFARDAGRVHKFARGLRYGMIAVNSTSVSSATTPFGGMRDSGCGREGGMQAIAAYSETKFCSVSL